MPEPHDPAGMPMETRAGPGVSRKLDGFEWCCRKNNAPISWMGRIDRMNL
jgi:hypothetical protein